MIVVTGADGFIGSAMVWKLNREGVRDILAVDAFPEGRVGPALAHTCYTGVMQHDEFLQRVLQDGVPGGVTALIHLGACAATTEQDVDYLRRNNTEYSAHLARWAVRRGVRFLYASSAATYGDGSQGFSDAEETTVALQPLNPYARSKQEFDLWLRAEGLSHLAAGFKFFNVFGPNEYHKGSMVSGVYRIFHQVRETGRARLFRSAHPDYANGEQRRDFVYVKDCVDAVWWFLRHPDANGLFNVGTGEARTWNDLARAVFAALDLPPQLDYVPLPEALRDSYQYHTQADLRRLRAVGYARPFTPLEEAVADYVRGYLVPGSRYLTPS